VSLGGQRLRIVAEDYAPQRWRVGAVWLNDLRLDRSWVRHAE